MKPNKSAVRYGSQITHYIIHCTVHCTIYNLLYSVLTSLVYDNMAVMESVHTGVLNKVN